MKVINLRGNKNTYSCNAYLVLGTWNSLSDMNTLVDIGTDGSIVDEIESMNTGVGKHPVEQVVITHNHFDHTGGLPVIRKRYNPKVYALCPFEGVDEVLKDGQTIRMGDSDFEVVRTPGHSSDSLCLYCEKEKVLFSGDTPIRIRTIGGSYSKEFVCALERLAKRNIRTIYPGHDMPIVERVLEIMRTTLANVKSSGCLNSL